ncbi:MAG: alpha-amylase family glycosyl hydrolase [Nocardioides sp.]
MRRRGRRTPAYVEGMGALPQEKGVAFRVWAPHAEAVHVIGTWNRWKPTATPLTHEGNGYWFGLAAKARPGHEYRFSLTTPDGELSRIDPYARQVTSSVGNGVILDHADFDWEDDDPVVPPHHELVVYELHIGSFYREDPDRPGNLALVLDKLDHLVRLGVNAVQIMPLMEFAGDLSWGYNPSHIFAVESTYGGPTAFKEFVREAHKRGLAVILDVVYNHFGPGDLDLWRFDGWSEHGKGGIYFYNDDRSQTPWGDTRPDYGREEVRRFIHDNAMSWLHDYHLDGLRFDMTPYIRSVHGSGYDLPEGWDLMRWVNLSLREQFPGAISIAEDMQQDPRISSTDDDGAAFHAQWDGAFVHPVRQIVIAPDDNDRSIAALKTALETRYHDDAFQRVVYTESHDEVANGRARVPYEVNADDPTGWHAQKRSTLGAALVLTAPGIPMIFQGQEFLQGEWFRDDVPLDWDHDESFAGIVRLYRDLIHLRRDADGLSKGLTGQHLDVFHANDPDNVVAYHRWADGGPGDDVVVVVNLSHLALEGYVVGLPAAGPWRLLLNSDATVYSPDFADTPSADVEAVAEPYDGLPARATVTLAPYSVLVYGRA